MFIPASGPAGTGEYYRCLALARALRRRHPQFACHFLLSREAAVERDPDITYHLLDDTPTRETGAVLALLERLRPGLVIFDSAGRQSQYRAARRIASLTVWISDRPGKRRRGFRWRTMRQFDLHLIAAPGQRAPGLGIRERLMCRLHPQLAVRFFSAIAPETDPALGAKVLESHGLVAGGYLLFVAGGGGYRHGGRPVPEILLDAAALAGADAGLRALVVLGPQYRGDVQAAPGVSVLPSVSTQALGALLQGCRAAVTGAGSMLVAQGVAAGVACVLVPAGGHDQPARIRELVEQGAALGAELEPAIIAAAVSRLARDRALRENVAEAALAAGLRNDVVMLAELLGRELSDRTGLTLERPTA